MKRNASTPVAVAVLVLLAAPAFAQEPDARSLYQKHCAQCHGADLQGGNAQSMVDGVWQFGAEGGYLFRNIKYGITHLGMPGFEKALSDDQIRALVQFLMQAERMTGATKPPPPEQLQTQDYEIRQKLGIRTRRGRLNRLQQDFCFRMLIKNQIDHQLPDKSMLLTQIHSHILKCSLHVVQQTDVRELGIGKIEH